LRTNGETSIPPSAQSWRRNWDKVIPFLAYPPELRKLIYTTNAIESLHRSLRKNVRNRGHFPNDDAAIKLLYLVIRNISAKWRMPQRGWKTVLNQFAILFEDRLQRAIWT
jgi:putative transposase